MTQPTPPAEGLEKAYALHYVTMGWALVVMELGSKGPKTAGWNTPANAIRTAHQVEQAFARGPMNQGLQHGYSNTCAVDVDHLEYTRLIWGEFGLDLEALLDRGCRIKGKDGRAKAIFRLPPGVVLPFLKITWLKQDAKHPQDVVTVFEMRSGSVQDVLPPSVHPDGHRYEWVAGKAPWDYAEAPDLPAELVEFWSRLPELREEIDNLCPWKPAAAVKRPQMRQRAPVGEHNDIIGQFNQANSVEDLLAQGGYRKKGKRWLAPSSSTKLPGVVVFKDGLHDRVFSHHGSDLLADGYAHDAFDLFVLFEHAGNVDSALGAAALQLGIERGGERPDVDLSAIQPWLQSKLAKMAPPVPEGQKLEAVVASQAPGAQAQPAPVLQLVPKTAKPKAKEALGTLPAGLLQPGGFVQGFMDYQLATAHRPQPILALVASLMAAATALGARICTPTGLRTNLYMISVAGTASGKDHGRKCIKSLFQAAQEDASQASKLIGPEGLSSGAALLTTAREQPTCLLQIDEFGMFLAAIASSKASSHEKSIAADLMKLYGSTGTIMMGTARADSKLNPRKDVPYPCIQLHGTTVAEPLFEAMGSKDLLSGFLNRFMVFFAPTDLPARQVVPTAPVPQDLADWVRAAQRLCRGGQGLTPDNPVVIPFNAHADAVLNDFGDWLDREVMRLSGTGMDALWGRAWEMAAKLALVFCCAAVRAEVLTTMVSDGSLVVDGTHAIRAVELVRLVIGTMVSECADRISDSEFEGLRKRVLLAIDRAGANGADAKRLAQHCRAWNNMSPKVRQDVISSLKEDGKIFIFSGIKTIAGQSAGNRYVADRFFGQADFGGVSE